MVKFYYAGNHKEDEAYMQRMCAQGRAAERLVEGFWTFAPCTPGQYCYRIAYLRGKSAAETARFQAECAEKGIEFVSRYSFWAIFRSETPFTFYAGEEEIALCERIYRPMPIGAALSAVVLLLLLYLTARVSGWFLILAALVLIYGVVCARCALSYRALLRSLKAAAKP